MNRPNKKDDPNYPFEFPDTYLRKLEKYCDHLEEILEGKEDYNQLLNKALDKACDELEFLTEEDENGDKWDSFLWKEWCLSDKDDVEKM